jgi:hypothetical protein
MKRTVYSLRNELNLFRTSIPIHLVAMIQPAVFYLLMSAILVHPTFDMNVDRPSTQLGWELVAAMKKVGSPIGSPYIKPVIVAASDSDGLRQVITIENQNGDETITQHYGLIDSNIVKNFRNRLTAAALKLWNRELMDRAIQVEEHPLLAEDMPYTVYFGMALLPMAVTLTASIVGGVQTAQEFEYNTILEYRLAPAPVGIVVGARLIRLVIISFISGSILLIAIGLVSGIWPQALIKVVLTLLPMGVIAGSLGIIVGLLAQKSIPALLVGLVTSFTSYLMGSAFGLAAGFNQTYEFVSRITPNTHTVELLYPRYFHTRVGNPWISIIYLTTLSLCLVLLTMLVYRQRVKRNS